MALEPLVPWSGGVGSWCYWQLVHGVKPHNERRLIQSDGIQVRQPKYRSSP
jgi:hypothetical protein